MNIKLNGNVVSIISDINYAALKKCTLNEPIFIKDKDGKKIYGVGVGALGQITNVGVTFTYANADGNAALNVCIPTEMSADEAKEYVLDNLNTELATLKMFEGPINVSMEALQNARAELAESITIG